MTAEESHFEDLTIAARVIWSFIYSSILVIGNCLCASIIAYERSHRSDRTRTIVNRLVSFQLSIIIYLNSIMMSLNISLMVRGVGGFSEAICRGTFWAFLCGIMSFHLINITITICRYMFIYKLKSLHLTNEDIIFNFLRVIIICSGTCFSSYLIFGYGVWVQYYAICMDSHPEDIFTATLHFGHFNPMAQTLLVSISINSYFLYKIWKAGLWHVKENKFVSWGVQIFILLFTLGMAIGQIINGDKIPLKGHALLASQCTIAVLPFGVSCYTYAYCDQMRKDVKRLVKKALFNRGQVMHSIEV